MEKTIQGKMFVTQFEMSVNEHALTDPVKLEQIVKERLARDLAQELIRSNHIEFTKQTNQASYTMVYRARVFAVPDDQVRILRKHEDFIA